MYKNHLFGHCFKFGKKQIRKVTEMSKCENCIHNEVCAYRHHYHNMVIDCKKFKDKSLYVELPCKVGDKVYIIENNEICEVMANKFEFDKYGNCIVLESDDLWFDTYWIDKLGKYYFLTYEEAERKLKEIEE